MKFEKDTYLFHMLLHELKDIVGSDDVSTSSSDKVSYSVDYYWISELWHDRGALSIQPDFIVFPQSV